MSVFEEVFTIAVINHIREIRRKKGITQIKMAEDLQVTRQTMNAIEKNKYNPSLELALKIIAYFEMPIEQVFILEEEDDK
ncbi:transcriptional regulator [Oceanobacillus sp. J11TS1]|nr:transcriptional regulator [Oceanobacillus sp. J11TS1]